MGNLDEMLNNQQQEKQRIENNTEYQEDKYNMLRILSNIAYYLGIVLLPLAVILFIVAIGGDKNYIAGISMGCLLGGINGLFFGLIGKCLIDIYNKVSQDK